MAIKNASVKVAACALINKESNILLIKRKTMPEYGKWSFPGGLVNQQEATEDAIKREVNEEIGIILDDVPQIFGVYTDIDYNTVVIVYYFVMPEQKLRACAEEVSEIRWFSFNEIPWENLAFYSTITSLKEFFSSSFDWMRVKE